MSSRRLGLTREEFITHDDAGRFGPAGEGEFAMRPWWPLSAVDAVLESVDAGTPVQQLWAGDRPDVCRDPLAPMNGTPSHDSA